MGFFEELTELRKNIVSCLIVFIAFSMFFFFFGISKINLFGKEFYFVIPTLNSISAQLLGEMKKDLLPTGVKLITTNPLNAFLAQVFIALFLGLIFSFPYLLYRIIRYLTPALYERERKAMIKVLTPSTLLFAGGCLFAYFLIVPPTLRILYSYATRLEALPFFTIHEFVKTVLGLVVGIGISFLLPVFMVLLTRLGLVESDFWKKKWRYAISGCLIVAAIITPDGTGITMLLLTLPLAGLYYIGCLLS